MSREENLNNPMGLKQSGVAYQHEVIPSSDPVFKQFTAMRWGIHAGMMNLLAYYRHDNCKTIRQIINRWAPSAENPTLAYIDFVCEQMGVTPDEDIQLNSEDNGLGLAAAICHFENGEAPCDAEIILQGVQSAYSD